MTVAGVFSMIEKWAKEFLEVFQILREGFPF